MKDTNGKTKRRRVSGGMIAKTVWTKCP